ncbi:MAG: hypothetical protein ACK4ND_02655 [Cytophagaceae bacterium]
MTDQNEETGQAQQIEVQQELVINQNKLEQYFTKLRTEQDLTGGLSLGVVAAIISAILWAAITVATQYKIAYMAIGLGFLVGYAIRVKGNGIDKIFGICGAALALVGCILGNYLSIIGFLAEEQSLGYFETLTLIPINLIPDIMVETFRPMDIVFYGFAIYQGYMGSFRVISEADIRNNAGETKTTEIV